MKLREFMSVVPGHRRPSFVVTSSDGSVLVYSSFSIFSSPICDALLDFDICFYDPIFHEIRIDFDDTDFPY